MSSPPLPPRFVPTLTEIVQPFATPTAVMDKSATSLVISAELEDLMVQRVLQSVDLTLDRRLREAVGQLILAHTESLAPRLREEIERVVRQSVSQAFEQEESRLSAGS